MKRAAHPIAVSALGALAERGSEAHRRRTSGPGCTSSGGRQASAR
jgi:hypothetical protein